MLSHSRPVQACQAGEDMSRRAASIEPEDGECTPSPSAVQQAKKSPTAVCIRSASLANPTPCQQEYNQGMSLPMLCTPINHTSHSTLCVTTHAAAIALFHFSSATIPILSAYASQAAIMRSSMNSDCKVSKVQNHHQKMACNWLIACTRSWHSPRLHSWL